MSRDKWLRAHSKYSEYNFKVRHKAVSFKTITWCKHSRRIEPIWRLILAFCHGDRRAVRPFEFQDKSSLHRTSLHRCHRGRATDSEAHSPKEKLPEAVGQSILPWDSLSQQNSRTPESLRESRKNEQKPEPDRRKNKKVGGDQVLHVVLQKCPPILRRWIPVGSGPTPGRSGGLKGSMQHLLKVFLYESMKLISFAGVNSNKTKALWFTELRTGHRRQSSVTILFRKLLRCGS